MTQRLLLTPGYSIRKVAAEVGISKHTVMAYRIGLSRPPCPCGKASGHQGWCSYLFAKSPSRQAYMLIIPRRTAMRNPGEFMYVTQFPTRIPHHTSRPCFVKGCPYPAIWAKRDVNGDVETCNAHGYFLDEESGHFDTSLRASFLAHTGMPRLDIGDFYPSEKVAVPKLRVATKWEMENYESQIR